MNPKLPVWQQAAVGLSLVFLASVIAYLVNIGAANNPSGQEAAIVAPSNTPAGSVRIETAQDAPLFQSTNDVQAAPALNSGGDGTIQPGSAGIQGQASSLQ